MKAHFLSLLLCIGLLFSACKKTALVNEKTTSAKADETANIELNDCLQKTYNDSNNISLCFEALDDSRCPSNAVCDWMGVARASFILTINGEPHNFLLATSNVLRDSTEITIQAYKIALLNVLPYPDGTTPAKRVAEVRITRF